MMSEESSRKTIQIPDFPIPVGTQIMVPDLCVVTDYMYKVEADMWVAELTSVDDDTLLQVELQDLFDYFYKSIS